MAQWLKTQSKDRPNAARACGSSYGIRAFTEFTGVDVRVAGIVTGSVKSVYQNHAYMDEAPRPKICPANQAT
jgi:hypothetical protein